jgi:hypothetical protein
MPRMSFFPSALKGGCCRTITSHSKSGFNHSIVHIWVQFESEYLAQVVQFEVDNLGSLVGMANSMIDMTKDITRGSCPYKASLDRSLASSIYSLYAQIGDRQRYVADTCATMARAQRTQSGSPDSRWISWHGDRIVTDGAPRGSTID